TNQFMNITNLSQSFRFTKENAREMAHRSWEARRERKRKLESEAQQGRQSMPQCERIALQIERVEQMMEKTSGADELQKLSATHARLFHAWQVLSATPNPGSWRGKPRPRQFPHAMPIYDPVEPIQPPTT
ncbi:MAG: hypothetical protein ABSE48_17080, partial [Verrucomicrobiota bacterium]